MKMIDYLQQIEHAVTAVTNLIWEEYEKLEILIPKVKKLTVYVQADYQRAISLQLSDDDDDYMNGIGSSWDNYWGNDKELKEKDIELEKLETKIATQRFSVGSLSGNLLQYAKQGISIVHTKPDYCPNGRFIQSQPLKNIIWQGRNQALHFEEGKPHPPADRCFETLSEEVDTKFLHYKSRNMGFEVIDLLNWRKFDNFKSDLLSLEKVTT